MRELATNILIQAAAAFLQHYPSFAQMSPQRATALATRLKLAYYPIHTTLLDPSHGPGTTFFIIQRGRVESRRSQSNELFEPSIHSALTDRLTQRILALQRAAHDLDDIAWCWIALGSEGHSEQTLNTDQDNALSFLPPPIQQSPWPANASCPLPSRSITPWRSVVSRSVRAISWPAMLTGA